MTTLTNPRRPLSEQVRPASDHRETNSPAKDWQRHEDVLQFKNNHTDDIWPSEQDCGCYDMREEDEV